MSPYMGEEIENIGPSNWSTAGSPYGVVHCYLSKDVQLSKLYKKLTDNNGPHHTAIQQYSN